MIQKETNLAVIDNSGAKWVQCIGIPGGTSKKSAKVGEIIIVSVKNAIPNGSVKKGDVLKAVIVRTVSNIVRSDGTAIKFNNNAVVLINNNKEPIGTRITGTVAREVRYAGFMRIISLAPEVL